jgi:cytosine/adenosine deaminase-related metal-dependent hydrolase
VTVQYGPAAVHWCSDQLLRLIAERSAAKGRRVHMHLLETKYQRAWADREIPRGIVRYLDDIGLLSPRLSLAHCVWARDDELDLIAERGVTIVVNTSSNLALRAGLAALPRMLARGCRVAMGLDGMALDEDEDALRELRLNYALAKGTGFDSTMSPSQALTFATANARFAIDGRAGTGTLTEGADADLLSFDLGSIEAEALEPGVPILPLALVRARKSDIVELTVAGRPVVKNGRLAALDLPELERELMARLRASLHTSDDLRAAMPELVGALSAHHMETCGCT